MCDWIVHSRSLPECQCREQIVQMQVQPVIVPHLPASRLGRAAPATTPQAASKVPLRAPLSILKMEGRGGSGRSGRSLPSPFLPVMQQRKERHGWQVLAGTRRGQDKHANPGKFIECSVTNRAVSFTTFWLPYLRSLLSQQSNHSASAAENSLHYSTASFVVHFGAGVG